MGNSCFVPKGHSVFVRLKITCRTDVESKEGLHNFKTIKSKKIEYKKILDRDGLIINLGQGVVHVDSAIQFLAIQKSDIKTLVDVKFGHKKVIIAQETLKKMTFVYEDHNEYLWRIVTDKVKLKQGDYIKLGKLVIKVCEIVKKKKYVKPPLTKMQSLKSTMKISNLSQQILCKICYTGHQPQNPLIVPCLCAGSMKYIHLSCVRQWIKKSPSFVCSQGYLKVDYKYLYCSICKEDYLNGEQYDAVTLLFQDKIEPPYIRLERMNSLKREENQLIIRALDSYEIRVGSGRHSTMDIKLGGKMSETVSNYHCKLTQSDGDVYIEDHFDRSMFGTMILIREPIELDRQMDQFKFQIGSTVIKVEPDITYVKEIPRYDFHQMPFIVKDFEKQRRERPHKIVSGHLNNEDQLVSFIMEQEEQHKSGIRKNIQQKKQ